MNLAFTMAVGDKRYGQFALNWALSVKAAAPKAKTALIFTPSAIDGIEQYISLFFDYTYQLQDSVIVNPVELAFKTKTEFYDIATQIAPDAEAYLFMDADTIMLSGRSVDEYFAELKDINFTMWCNDVYNFETQSRMRDDYTFWCEPVDVAKSYAEYWLDNSNKPLSLTSDNIIFSWAKMPQVNSSFIYFKRLDIINGMFEIAKYAWSDTHLPYKKYRGVKPDEFCFNFALAQANILPHQIPYYPIFFTFASSNFEEQYIRTWKSIGFAGDTLQQEGVVHLYNHVTKYLRELYDIEYDTKIALEKETKPKDRHPLVIEPVSKKTIFRRDEVPNSAGGIFNPDGIYVKELGYVTILRKEKNTDFYKVGHNQATAIPHLQILGPNRDEHFELTYENKPAGVRFEDFRIVWANEKLMLVSHTIIENNLTSKMNAKIGASVVDFEDKSMRLVEVISLPLEPQQIEKNWVFFTENDAECDTPYCIYSLQPYRLFKQVGTEWKEVSVFQPELDWFHKGQRICNSTRPVLIGNEYVMLFHTREKGIYFQGAVIIDKETKDITHYTKRSIPIKQWAEGFQPNLIYVSGLLYVEERNLLRVFFGEADSHSCYNDYKADEFVALIKQNSVFDSNNNDVLKLIRANQ